MCSFRVCSSVEDLAGLTLLDAVLFVGFVKVRYDIRGVNQFAAVSGGGLLVQR
jgi:hypothetical protein